MLYQSGKKEKRPDKDVQAHVQGLVENAQHKYRLFVQDGAKGGKNKGKPDDGIRLRSRGEELVKELLDECRKGGSQDEVVERQLRHLESLRKKAVFERPKDARKMSEQLNNNLEDYFEDAHAYDEECYRSADFIEMVRKFLEYPEEKKEQTDAGI